MQALLIDRWWSWIVPLSWQLAVWVALIAGIAWLARKAPPQVRYVLWTLVLVKAFLPPSLAVNWGVGHWGLAPIWDGLQPPVATVTENSVHASSGRNLDAAATTSPSAEAALPAQLKPREVLFGIWLLGVVVVGGSTWWQYRRLVVRTRAMQSVDEGPVRISLERLALTAGLQNAPDLLVSRETLSPFLFGLLRPRIVLPESLIDELSPRDLEGVLLHELSHCRRGDLWVGAVQAIVQSLLWFHPLVWWANARLRQERECACDQNVLNQAGVSPADYGQSLLSVLAVAKGRALYQANLVGVFEPGANIQQRLEEIMKDQPHTRTTALWYLALASLLLVFLPMAAVNSATQETAAPPAKEVTRPMPAWIVETSPAIGATDVDPNITEISVTFDRDMDDKWSWTGGPPLFPPVPEGEDPYWRDKRTCVLPVKLKKGTYYRVGINSTSFLKFRSLEGQPAPCTAIYFVTEGATKAIQSRVRVPKIVKMIPKNGATDVDPNIKAIRVTFDVPMGGGMSWTGSGENYPAGTGESPKWSSDGKTCTMQVMLEAGHKYELGINSLNHINFQSRWGVPVVPVVYQFTTEAAQ
jgi:beta-lactamase regulating signal transducer with metallopeptidase domain